VLLFLLQSAGSNQEFAVRCAACHGADGRSGERVPAIFLDLRELIRKGFPTAGMPGFGIPEPKLAAIVARVRPLGEWRKERAIGPCIMAA